jgi:Arc/MetJ family transcription regulator
MRTNIEIDDKLMADAQRLSGLPTKKAVVEEALRLLIQLKNQSRIRELRGKIQWEGDLEAWRRDDDNEAA